MDENVIKVGSTHGILSLSVDFEAITWYFPLSFKYYLLN